MEFKQLKNILEAALLAAATPMSILRLSGLFDESENISNGEIGRALESLGEDCTDRGVELVEVASGFRYQVRQDVHAWVAKMWTERPSRYSRALLETLALIAYRQPITRGEIEAVRGVTVSTSIIKTLEEREWIRVVGHRDVPGRPALFGTTREFLDYFKLKSLDELPTLSEIRDMEAFDPELNLDGENATARASMPEAEADADTDTDTETETPDGDTAAAEASTDESNPNDIDTETPSEAEPAATAAEASMEPQPATADEAPATTADDTSAVDEDSEEKRA
jgi:segregation and condensation protein B